MNTRRVSALCGLLVWALPGVLPARADETYTLRRVYRTGEKDRYRTNIQIESDKPVEGTARKIEFTLTTTETTKEVRDDGTVVVAITLDPVKAHVDGDERTISDAPVTITTTYDKIGKILRQEGGSGPLVMIASLLNTARVNFTQERPLRIGEERKTEVPTGRGSQSTVKSVLSLLGWEKKNDEIPVDTLRIKSVVDSPAPQGNQKVHMEVTAFVEADTGKPLKVDIMLTGTQFGPLPDARITIKRIRVNK